MKIYLFYGMKSTEMQSKDWNIWLTTKYRYKKYTNGIDMPKTTQFTQCINTDIYNNDRK